MNSYLQGKWFYLYCAMHQDGNLVDSCGLVKKIIETVWSFPDITERQQAEREMRRTLVQEKQLGKHKGQFVSMICHDFRTSLNIISFSTSLLKRHHHHWSEEKKLQYLQRLQTAVEHLSQLMDEVLIIDKAEAGKLKLEPKPLNLLESCHDILAEINLSESSQRTVTFVSQGDCKAVSAVKSL